MKEITQPKKQPRPEEAVFPALVYCAEEHETWIKVTAQENNNKKAGQATGRSCGHRESSESLMCGLPTYFN